MPRVPAGPPPPPSSTHTTNITREQLTLDRPFTLEHERAEPDKCVCVRGALEGGTPQGCSWGETRARRVLLCPAACRAPPANRCCKPSPPTRSPCARWRQYRFHVDESDAQVVVSVALEGQPGQPGSADLFLKAQQPAGGRWWVGGGGRPGCSARPASAPSASAAWLADAFPLSRPACFPHHVLLGSLRARGPPPPPPPRLLRSSTMPFTHAPFPPGWGPRQYDLRPRWNAATDDRSLEAVLEPGLSQWRAGAWFAGVVRGPWGAEGERERRDR
jgi:hypothetical protein